MIRKCKLIPMPTKIWKCRSIMGGEERIHRKEEQRKLYCSLFVNGLSLGDKACKSKKVLSSIANCLTHLQLFNCLTHEAT